MVNELESALWEAANPIRTTRFAHVLQQARRSSRSGALPGPSDQLQGWELSFDPAIHRTLSGYVALDQMRLPTEPDRAWVDWNEAAKRAMCRVAAKCWSGIDQDIRRAFIDTDNFHPIWGETTFSGLREDKPGRHLNFEGLDALEVQERLDRVFQAVRATPTYAAAREAANRLRADRKRLQTWGLLAQEGLRQFELAGQLAIADGADRAREVVRTLYVGSSVEAEAAAMWKMNRLAQQVVWTLLGHAEMSPGPVVIESVDGTIRSTVDRDGSPFLRLTSQDERHMLVRLTNPVMLRTGTPFDGLYVVVGVTMSLGNLPTSDLSLLPVRWSASQWPGASPTSPS